ILLDRSSSLDFFYIFKKIMIKIIIGKKNFQG
ncbi:unnamed protein product, partial [marine sediment metagenome]